MQVDFQVVHDFADKNILIEKIINILNEFDKVNYYVDYFGKDEEEDINLIDYIEIKYHYKVNNNDDFITGFSIFIPGIGDYIIDFSNDRETGGVNDFNNIIDDLISSLKEEINIKVITKFLDESMQCVHWTIFRELFVIEMKLREIITFIFLANYENQYNNLLNDYKIKFAKDMKKDDLTRNYENEFFYILFSDYLKLDESNLKEMTNRELINFINKSDTFEEFQQFISNRGIKKYNKCLLEINDSLEIIEQIRNCIAHNRKISNRLMAAYEVHKKKLLGDEETKIAGKLDKFWQNLQEGIDND